MFRGGAREGAGRPRGITHPTKVIRVSEDLEKTLVDNLPQLLELLKHWDEELESHPTTRTSNPRYWKAHQLRQDIKNLGY